MSIRVMASVWDNGPEDRSELLVLLALADFANDAGECWPSMIGIAEKARMTERGAQKIVRRLEETGWLEIVTGGGRGGKNSYRIKAEKPEQETGNAKRGMDEKPRTAEQKPRTGEQKTPNGGSPEPSRTIMEPSIGSPLYSPEPEKPDKARIPDGWVPSDEGWAYARSLQIPDEAIQDEARGFQAYWADRTDRDARKSFRGWEQCWQGWCRRIASRYQPRRGMAGASFPGGYGQGGSIASIVARRRAAGEA